MYYKVATKPRGPKTLTGLPQPRKCYFSGLFHERNYHFPEQNYPFPVLSIQDLTIINQDMCAMSSLIIGDPTLQVAAHCRDISMIIDKTVLNYVILTPECAAAHSRYH